MKKAFFSSLIILSILLSALFVVSPAHAAGTIYVRPGGDDTQCNGTVDVDYSSSALPNCAKKTIQAGVTAIDSGGTVYVSSGTYSSSTINISKPVTIEGQGSASTIINAGAVNGYGLDINNTAGFILKKVKVQPVTGTYYAIKISGSNNIEIEDVEITGAVRSGLDLIGCNTAILKNISSHDNGGVGIAISNSTAITLTEITTSDNSWGGVGLFTNKTFYTGKLSDGKTGLDGITLTGTNSFGEPNPLYLDYDDPSHVIRNFVQSDFEYVVRSNASGKYVYYQKTTGNALFLIYALDSLTTPPGLFKPTAAIQRLSDGSFHVFNTMKIQPAIDLAEAGKTVYVYRGTYNENITVNKQIKLIGSGSGDNDNTNTILRKNIDSAVVSLSASGTETFPIVLQDMRIEPNGVYGINVATSSTVEYIMLKNVKVVGTKNPNDTESEVGLKVSTSTTLRNLTVEDSSFDGLHYGWYFAKHGDWDSGSSTVENILVRNTTFNENANKGIYVEKLSKATFENITVNGNGWNTSFWNAKWNGGIDINLKGETGGKSYQDLVFRNVTIKNNGLGVAEGAGLMIKARDDGNTYSQYPASLTNVQIIGGTIEGNERGIRFGEPGKNNLGPEGVVIKNVILKDNNKTYTGTDGSAYGAVINHTQSSVKAEENYWGTLSWFGYQTVSGIQSMVYGDVDWQPWSNDTFTEDYEIPTITYADDDNAGKSEGETGFNGGIFGYDAFVIIKDAITHVAAGGSVYVGEGTYVEQVVVDKNIDLIGAGIDTTIIESPVSLPISFTTSATNKPVVFVKDGAEAVIQNLTVDGANKGNSNYRFVGIGFYNAGGEVNNVKVINIQDEPFSGSQHGVGIYAYNGDNQDRSLVIEDTLVEDFQKNGITVVGSGFKAVIRDNEIFGKEATSTIAQNGIQTWGVTSAVIEGNLVDGIAYSGGNWGATGILLYGPSENMVISKNTIQSSQIAIYDIETEAEISQNKIQDPACVGDGCYGILIGDPPGALPSALEDIVITSLPSEPLDQSMLLQAENPSFNVDITDNEIEGSYYPNKESIGLGIYIAYFGDNDVTVNAKGNILKNWNNGVVVDKCQGSSCTQGNLAFLSVNENALEDNLVGLNLSNVPPDLNFEKNWWQSKFGPQVTGNPKGNGQAIEGGTVDYIPWLCDGTDTQPNVLGFQPDANAATCTNLATRLVFTQYPSSAFENIPFAQQPIVRAEDDDGNLVITFDNFVFLDLANNPVGGMLLPGPYYTKAVDGVATFSGLYINKAGQGYSLEAFGIGSSGNFILTEGDAFDVLKQQADLAISLADSPDPVNAGEALSYAVTVSNDGPHVAQGVSVTLQLPTGVVFQTATGTGWSCAQSGGVVTCTRAASLASGQIAPEITVQVTAPTQAGPITATASVILSDSMEDPDPDNNEANTTTTVVELPPTGPSYILYLPLVLNNTP